jgi:RNase H-fold protein (predicted Holliday junction resolvase)
MSVVLGIDPGTRKCGYAIVEAPAVPAVVQGIVDVDDLLACLLGLSKRFSIRVVALGGGTYAQAIADIVRVAGLGFVIVDERETTLRARARYFQAHPPRGWKRFIPRGMLLPLCPIDDFAALLIAERLLEKERAEIFQADR